MADEPVRIPIEHELDLHAFAPRDIASVVDEYVDAAAAAGLREVRLVHGRGRGVQRGIVQAALERHARVVEFWDDRIASRRDRRAPDCRIVRARQNRQAAAARARETGAIRVAAGYALARRVDQANLEPATRRVATVCDEWGLRSRTGRLRSARPASPARRRRRARAGIDFAPERAGPLASRKSLNSGGAPMRVAQSAREWPMRDADFAIRLNDSRARFGPAISSSCAARAGGSSHVRAYERLPGRHAVAASRAPHARASNAASSFPSTRIDPIDRPPRPRRVRAVTLAARLPRADRRRRSAGRRCAPRAIARIDLLPHQLEPAMAILRGLGTRVLLADEVGLGKTIQAGLVVSELLARGAIERVLVLTPPGLRDQWLQELADALRDRRRRRGRPIAAAARRDAADRRQPVAHAVDRGRVRSTTSSGRRCFPPRRPAGGISSSSTKRMRAPAIPIGAPRSHALAAARAVRAAARARRRTTAIASRSSRCARSAR